jgi:glycerol-3-phosphate acyltransferase PlsY
MLEVIISLVASYLAGSVNLSVWIGKKLKGVDIRTLGSGNAGTTNTFRLLGWKAGLTVAIIDIFKGYASSKWLSQIAIKAFEPGYHVLGWWNIEAFMVITCGLFAVLGHMFPVFMGFRGGKGAITAAGMLFAVEPISVSLALVVFSLVLFTSRYVSLASIVATASYPVFLGTYKYGLGYKLDPSYFIFSLITSVVIIVKHRSNIERLLAGTENRVRSFAPAKGWLNKNNEDLKTPAQS